MRVNDKTHLKERSRVYKKNVMMPAWEVRKLIELMKVHNHDYKKVAEAIKKPLHIVRTRVNNLIISLKRNRDQWKIRFPNRMWDEAMQKQLD